MSFYKTFNSNIDSLNTNVNKSIIKGQSMSVSRLTQTHATTRSPTVRNHYKNKFVYAYEKLTKVSCKREINNLYEDNETLNPSNKFIKSSRYYIITTNYF